MSPTSKSLWAGFAVLALVVPTGLAAQRLWAPRALAPEAGRPDELLGVRLGMTASALRDAVALAQGAGRWETALGDDGLVRMDWTPQATPDSRSEARRATFELHEGVLVAVRAYVTAASPVAATPLIVSAGSVRRYENLGPEGARITLIARNCPNHRAEVATLLASD
ncbi:MAG: hypothetical protein AAF447_20060 [Myxococcota bacterium]